MDTKPEWQELQKENKIKNNKKKERKKTHPLLIPSSKLENTCNGVKQISWSKAAFPRLLGGCISCRRFYNDRSVGPKIHPSPSPPPSSPPPIPSTTFFFFSLSLGSQYFISLKSTHSGHQRFLFAECALTISHPPPLRWNAQHMAL